MTVVEKVARAVTDELGRQDGYDAPAWKLENGLKLAWLDQGDVDMGLVARAALTALQDSFADPVVRAAIQAALDEKDG